MTTMAKVGAASFCLAICMMNGTTQAAPVFLDDFSDPDGTVLNGKASDIGGNWIVNGGDNATAVQSGAVTSANLQAFALMTSILHAGQTLTLTFDTLSSSLFGNSAGYSFLDLRDSSFNRRFDIGSAWAGTNWSCYIEGFQ